ncbi:MAG TPA: fumarylacetoacetate hydrolase family protein [Xanthobacteraceae bacterium]|jgi:2-keto-4-pentenoate hydratase/2-oxohepta-3-ene-1,7-dioic acid hydratase in catechol pathway
MRLVTFAASGRQRLGALIDNDRRIVDFLAAQDNAGPAFQSMQALIEGGAAALDRAREIIGAAQKSGRGVIDAASVKLMAPLPTPPQLRDFLCFEKHLIQAFTQILKIRAASAPDPEQALRDWEKQGAFKPPQGWYERPSFYKPSRFAVCGTGQDVTWPAYSKTIDYELEFACVIGTAGRDIPKDKARAHIFGYTIFNDLSARDEQTLEMANNLGPGKGKDFDNSNPIGPCIVTADEIPDPYALDMIVRVNGEERGRGNSREMHWKYEDCIAFVSRNETIHPGELFCSGTVGNGSGLEIGRYVEPGEVVELEVEKIGVLRNRIVR